MERLPRNLLGYRITTALQIIINILVPACLETLLYIIQTLADLAVGIQHLREENTVFAAITIALVCLPAAITFVAIVTSPWQWPEDIETTTFDDTRDSSTSSSSSSSHCFCIMCCCCTNHHHHHHQDNVKFFVRQLTNLLLFPFGAIFRFCWRIFWSVEALFYDDESFERYDSVSKATETSSFELYLFVQAYFQSAPQIILQMFILLREDVWRDYETSNMQALSIICSFINMAIITTSFQRFESQKIVGKSYPWSSERQVKHRQQKIQQTKSQTEEIQRIRKEGTAIRSFPENEQIYRRFHSQHYEQNGECDREDSLCEQQESQSQFHQRDNNEEHQTTAVAAGNQPADTKLVVADINFNKESPSRTETMATTTTSTNNSNSVSAANKRSLEPKNITDDDKLIFGQNHVQIPIKTEASQNNGGIDEVDIGKEKRLPKRYLQTDFDVDFNAIEYAPIDNDDVLIEKKDTPRIDTTEFDKVPDFPAPPPPPLADNIGQTLPTNTRERLETLFKENEKGARDSSQNFHYFNPVNRLSTFRDMLMLNAEIYIREHVPRPPSMLTSHLNDPQHSSTSNYFPLAANNNNSNDISADDISENQKFSVARKIHGKQQRSQQRLTEPISKNEDNSSSRDEKTLLVNSRDRRDKNSPGDETDFFMPSRMRLIKGVAEDDLIGKFVAFFGWFMFIFMRMISLSCFSVFYPWQLLVYIIGGHYSLMVIWLILETRLQAKIHRLAFYAILAYIYIFALMEFKIKFKRLRLWYIGYFSLVLAENFIITIVWWNLAEFESWWFRYLYVAILLSGILNLACMLVYYSLLKPDDVILLEQEEKDEQK